MEEESVAELGNIIFNSCLSNNVDLLDGSITSRLPQLSRGHYMQLLQGYAEDIGNDDFFYMQIGISAGETNCQACILWTGLSWDMNA